MRSNGQSNNPDTDQLLNRVADGDESAVRPLLSRHRGRLRQMVAVRLSRQLAARIDPSDVVQESLLEASQRLDEYLTTRPIPFYPWLRQIAWERLLDEYERHVRTQKRAVSREAPQFLSNESVLYLADRLVARGSSPSRAAIRNETRRRVQSALQELSDSDREILVLRYLEKMSVREIAAVLRISEGAVRMRQLRALERMREQLGNDV